VIRVVVVSHQGGPVGRALEGRFGPEGGTIGRASTNTLVLDDPDRTVSRVHAQIVCRGDAFFIVDRGSNPMLCNGRSLGAGNEVPMADGDRLVIGGFELKVEAQQSSGSAALAASAGNGFGDDLGLLGTAPNAAAHDDDPFADLLAGLGAPTSPTSPSAPVPSPARAAAPSFPSSPSTDSLLFANPLESGPSRGGPTGVDPFADLLGPDSSARSGATPGSSSADRSPGALDDFSDLGLRPAGKAAGIDDLFGTGGGLGGDPLALSPLADPLLQPNTASNADPFAALQGKAKPTAAPRSDHVQIGNFGYAPPVAVVHAAMPVPVPVPARPLPHPHAPAPQFDDQTGSPVGNATSDAELLAALLRGLGGLHKEPPALTPELMERIGIILRSATEGTLQLLLARQELKREVRAEVTMIASQANNPLKFSPTVEVALAHLLCDGVRGFMPPEVAMRDAFDDLRAHQFGVMVGMRAALAHVIGRFTPEELEKKIAAKSALDSLFAANRKAKLWDQFVALYGGIAAEAEDDFHSLFGKAFLEAYEAQMARLRATV
jgi:FHA domain-containing protein